MSETLRPATWWRGSRGDGGRLGAVCDLVCELTGESERGGHGGRWILRWSHGSGESA